MTALFSRVCSTALCVSALVVAVASPASAQSGAAKDGGFIGVTVMPKFTFDGVTFDGETVYKEIDGEELSFLPRVNEEPLFRGILGYRQGHYALEVSYDRVVLDGTFEGFEMESTFQSLNVNGRYYFVPRSRVQPYVLFGGSFPWLNIEDSSVLDDQVGDSRFKGWGVNAGAGLAFYPVSQFGISVGYDYRAVWFDRVTGVSDRLFELRPRFREESGSVSVTGTIIF